MIFINKKNQEKCVFRIPSEVCSSTIYLTFDDGPNDYCTEDVLAVLNKHNIKATFFCIAEKAIAHKDIVSKMISQGHAIGNHSLNHHYRLFFSSKETIGRWIEKSESLLQSVIGRPTIGFRPPAGVVTPSIFSSLLEKNIPLILWNVRYFDTVFKWSRKRAEKKICGIESGSIILLHDVHRGQKKECFLDTLSYFIENLKERGFTFSVLDYRRENGLIDKQL